MLSKLFGFLLKLSADEFYGDVTIRFRKGDIGWPIEVQHTFKEDTLPQPDMTNPVYQKLLAETLRGQQA